jgi:hypothetical protein
MHKVVRSPCRSARSNRRKTRPIAKRPTYEVVCFALLAAVLGAGVWRLLHELLPVFLAAYRKYGFVHWTYVASLVMLAALTGYTWCATVVFLRCQRILRERFEKWAGV